MTDKPSHSTDPGSQPLSDTEVTVNTSRRRLTGAGLGVSAIFTLASRPVLAAHCTSASAAVSGNLSQHGTPLTCTGLSPGYWKQHPESWPSPYLPGKCENDCNKTESWSSNSINATLFHPVFYGDKFFADLDSNPITEKTSLSMMQVLKMNDGSNPWGLEDADNLGAHIVAALLNAASGKTNNALTESNVKTMWQECQMKGYFEPLAGVEWYPPRVVEYIVSTFEHKELKK